MTEITDRHPDVTGADEAPAAGPGRGRRPGRLTTGALVLTAPWLVGQVFRDATWLTGMCFYVPSPVLAVLLLACGALAWRGRRRMRAGLFVAAALAPAFFVLFVENQFFPSPPAAAGVDALRLVHWNVSRGWLGWEGIVDELREESADVVVISEAPKDAVIDALAAGFGPDYSGEMFSNLAVVARGNLADGQWLHKGEGLKVYGLVWASPHGACRMLVVDLASNPMNARAARLEEVRSLMVDWRADVVVGDFNAPRRSRALSPLPPGFVHACEAVGSGWSYTWPSPCPVYAIDQCILGARATPLAYDLTTSWRSDHRRQIVEFALRR